MTPPESPPPPSAYDLFWATVEGPADNTGGPPAREEPEDAYLAFHEASEG